MNKLFNAGQTINVATTQCNTCKQHVKVYICASKHKPNGHIEAHLINGNVCSESGEELLCRVRVWFVKESNYEKCALGGFVV